VRSNRAAVTKRRQEEILRKLAIRDDSLVPLLMADAAQNLAVSGLDPTTHALAQLAALIASRRPGRARARRRAAFFRLAILRRSASTTRFGT
jgi:hypothetical protein